MAENAEIDHFNLQRFVDAQSHVFDEVCVELQEGRKRGHWMWFIFPQIEGLIHFRVRLNRGIPFWRDW